jgi:hypothetical protein
MIYGTSKWVSNMNFLEKTNAFCVKALSLKKNQAMDFCPRLKWKSFCGAFSAPQKIEAKSGTTVQRMTTVVAQIKKGCWFSKKYYFSPFLKELFFLKVVGLLKFF